jgi:predicted  nucleic acid-binding Zn-ribbon protein
VNADPAVQLRLLDLQAVDTALAQLVHRREHLPENDEIAALDAKLIELDADVVAAETEVSDLSREQKRIDRDVEQVRQRSDRDRARLQAGGLPSKELESLQHEVASLERRQSTLEDEELEIMERCEEAEGRLTAARQAQQQARDERSVLDARRSEMLAEIDASVKERDAERAAVAGDIPVDLLALYDKIRAANGGVGAAALRQRRCEGCRIELAGADLSAARTAAADLVLRCDNCRRILVRTAESGL